MTDEKIKRTRLINAIIITIILIFSFAMLVNNGTISFGNINNKKYGAGSSEIELLDSDGKTYGDNIIVAYKSRLIISTYCAITGVKASTSDINFVNPTVYPRDGSKGTYTLSDGSTIEGSKIQIAFKKAGEGDITLTYGSNSRTYHVVATDGDVNSVVVENTTTKNTITPENTVIPENTVEPKNTVSPENTVEPKNTVTPENIVDPKNTVVPENTVDPKNTVTPENVVDPKNTVEPENTVIPENIVEPTNTVTPENTVENKISDDPKPIVNPSDTKGKTIKTGNDSKVESVITFKDDVPSSYSLNVEKKDVIDSLKTANVVSLYDIKVLSNGVEQEITNKDMAIKIKTDDLSQYNSIKVAYIKNGSIVETYPAAYENGYVIFNANHLSEYGIIAEKKEVNPTPTPVTNNINELIENEVTPEENKVVNPKDDITNNKNYSGIQTVSPKTGDINVGLYVTLAVISVLAITYIIKHMKD